jgi:hypothetical protein
MNFVVRRTSAVLALTLTPASAAFAQTPPAPVAAPAPPADPAPIPVAADRPHFRWGVSPSAGTFFPGPTTVAFGIEGRAGYAFNDTVTVFGSLGGVGGVGFGGSVGNGGGSASVSAVSYWYMGANVDALIAKPFFIGGGAALGRGGWGVVKDSASSTGGSQEVIAAGGFIPQLDGRLGLALGRRSADSGKYSGVTIALDLRVLAALDSASTKQVAGVGGASQSVTTSTTALGFSPMLMIGYDVR